jgi:DNA-binding MarR family transcriptional regulator
MAREPGKGSNVMDAKVRKDRLRKELFAPLPIRAISDQRLSGRHLRVLAAIAYHDRFGRNGQGCWAGRRRLAAEAGIAGTHVSNMLSDLRSWAYIKSERHPMNRRTTIHRVIYDDSNRYQIQYPSKQVDEADRYRLQDEQVPPRNANALEGNGKGLSNILGINLRIDSAEAVSENSEFEKRDCAEARTSEIEKTKISEAQSYLQAVNDCTSDTDSILALKYEHARLSQIATDDRMPPGLRDWAARLRGVAEGVR